MSLGPRRWHQDYQEALRWWEARIACYGGESVWWPLAWHVLCSCMCCLSRNKRGMILPHTATDQGASNASQDLNWNDPAQNWKATSRVQDVNFNGVQSIRQKVRHIHLSSKPWLLFPQRHIFLHPWDGTIGNLAKSTWCAACVLFTWLVECSC